MTPAPWTRHLPRPQREAFAEPDWTTPEQVLLLRFAQVQRVLEVYASVLTEAEQARLLGYRPLATDDDVPVWLREDERAHWALGASSSHKVWAYLLFVASQRKRRAEIEAILGADRLAARVPTERQAEEAEARAAFLASESRPSGTWQECAIRDCVWEPDADGPIVFHGFPGERCASCGARRLFDPPMPPVSTAGRSR